MLKKNRPYMSDQILHVFSVIYLISKGGDMYFKPIFAWNIYFEDNSYKTWLKTNHMPNTAKNFRKYFKEKA